MVQIDELLGNRICLKILRLFLKNPLSEFNQSKINRTLKIAKLSSIKWLSFLAGNKMLLKRYEGRMIYYRLDRDNPVMKQLKVLFTVGEMLERLASMKIRDKVYLFGSASRGEDTENSDIDILVIGNDRSVIGRIRSAGFTVKISFFTPVEWLRMVKEDKAFYERVEKDKIRLI